MNLIIQLIKQASKALRERWDSKQNTAAKEDILVFNSSIPATNSPLIILIMRDDQSEVYIIWTVAKPS